MWAQITRQSWFPTALALWFAALVGLTIMVLPAALLASWGSMPRPSGPQHGIIAITLAFASGLGALKAAQRVWPSRHPASPQGLARDDAALPAVADTLDLAPFASLDDDNSPLEIVAEATAATSTPGHCDPPSQPARPKPRHPLSDAPLDTLGIVELLERLALAIVDWRERHPGEQLPAAAGLAVRDVLQSRTGPRPAEGTECTDNLASPGCEADSWCDEPDEDDWDEEGEDADGYSSLLDMTARHRMIRLETAPDDHAIDDSLNRAHPPIGPDRDQFIDEETTLRSAQIRFAP